MPKFSSRRRFSKRRFSRRSRPGFWSKAGGYAMKALRIAKYVKSIVNVERKYIDFGLNFAPGSTPIIGDFSTIGTGTDYNERIGNSIKLKSFYLRGVLTGGSGTTTYDYFRFMILIDKEANGSLPAALDILEYSDFIWSPLNHVNGTRFKVLMDKVIPIGLPNAANYVHHLKRFINLNHHMKYLDAGATTASVKEGNLIYLMVGTNNTQKATFEGASRIRFIDN